MNINDRKFLYFPSFSVGVYGSAIVGNKLFDNKMPTRFYSNDFPESFRHPYFLITAGHFYKKKNYRKDIGFDKYDDGVLLGDSGGFQICTGALEWKNSLCKDIFNWLEENCDVAINLDIPPRGIYKGKFNECFDKSKENFKYFADNQSGKVDFLNVLQGIDDESYMKWYNGVKDFPFQGWSLGSCTTLYKMMSAISILLDGKEHQNKRNKYLHMLGASKIPDLMILSQLQKSFNEVGSNMVVTTDSSSPGMSVIFGTYFIGVNLKSGTLRSIHIPKNDSSFSIKSLPKICEFDKYLDDMSDIDDILNMTAKGYHVMTVHNLMFFKDVINQINEFVYSDSYLLKQVINADMYLVLQSIDEMIKSDDPLKVFNKYSHHYIKLSNMTKESVVKDNKFFQI